MKRVLVALVALLAVLSTVVLTATAQARTAKGTSDVYVVLLEEAPAGAYEGGVAGYPATKPAPGRKYDKNSANTRKYTAYLQSRHADVANRVGATRMYDYVHSLNGFAASLTSGQVNKLRDVKGVVSVRRDQLSHPHTDNTPTFLGLNASGGIWSQLGGQSSAGEGVIIGVVDTGIWPEHPSFADTGYGPAPARFHGTCQAGERWTKHDCSDKLIGARFYSKGIGHFGGDLAPEYESPRDHDGHGTHTASTAAGNGGV